MTNARKLQIDVLASFAVSMLAIWRLFGIVPASHAPGQDGALVNIMGAAACYLTWSPWSVMQIHAASRPQKSHSDVLTQTVHDQLNSTSPVAELSFKHSAQSKGRPPEPHAAA